MRPLVGTVAAFVIVIITLGSVQAQSPSGFVQSNDSSSSGGPYSVILATNGQAYTGAQTVLIAGKVSPAPPSSDTVVSLTITVAGGAPIVTLIANVSSLGYFTTSLTAGSGPGWTSGTYVLTAYYYGTTATTKFTWAATPFSVFWITDTQFLSDSNEPLFAKTTQWIANYWTAYNAKMVVHTGDIVNDASVAGEWKNASKAMSTLLSKGIPYTWNAGNHDILNTAEPSWLGSDYSSFNPSVVSKDVNSTGYSGWAGSFDDGMDTAVTFTADNLNFLVVNIEFNGNASVLAWVRGLLSNPLYENYHVMIATHAYIDFTGNTDDARWGAIMANFTTGLTSIMNNDPNVFMTMNGHYGTPTGYHITTNGRYELMFNRQDCVDSEGCPPEVDSTPDYLKDGAATITVITFDPARNLIEVRTFALDMDVWLTDAGDQFYVTPMFLQSAAAASTTSTASTTTTAPATTTSTLASSTTSASSQSTTTSVTTRTSTVKSTTTTSTESTTTTRTSSRTSTTQTLTNSTTASTSTSPTVSTTSTSSTTVTSVTTSGTPTSSTTTTSTTLTVTTTSRTLTVSSGGTPTSATSTTSTTTVTTSTTSAPILPTSTTSSTVPLPPPTTSTSSQTSVITSSTTYTEAQVIQQTTGSQGQISGFLANETIPVTINVGTTAASFASSSSAFSVSLTPGKESLSIGIGAQGVSGPRVVLLNISKDSFLNLQSGYLQVSVDNSTVAEAGSLQAVLTGSGSPSYVLIGTSSGFELLVSIPHFSTHTIVIRTPAPAMTASSSSQTSISTSTSAGSASSEYASYGAGIAVAAVVLVAVFAIAKKLDGSLASRDKKQIDGGGVSG